MKQHNKNSRNFFLSLSALGLGLSLMTVANSSAATLTSERQIETNQRLHEAKPVAGRNRRRINSAINLSDYPKANADRVSVSSESSKLRINVLSNDRGFKLRVVDINSRSAGGASVSISHDMAVYKVPRDFKGKDSFWYTLEDKSGRQHSAKVIVCICDKK